MLKDKMYYDFKNEMFIEELKHRKTRAYRNAQRAKAMKIALVVTTIIAIVIIL